MIKAFKILLCALALMMAASLAAADTLDLSALEDIEEVQMVEMEGTPEWTYPIPYELLKTSDYIRLSNRENLLEEDYIPEDLVELTCRKVSYDPIEMREVAAQAISDLFDAAKEDGIYLYAHSGYRSYRTQKTMYYNRLERNNGKDDGIVAYPGSSEHQMGLALDVTNKSGIGKKFTREFRNTKEGKWLEENCWDYGFIIRYQPDKEDITKIKYEPWHLRYVGVQVAQYMRDEHLCLEEFTTEWKEAVAEYEAAE